MYLPKIREIKEALTSLFTAPYTTKFPAGPFEAAVEYRGRPRYNEADCVGCGTCVQVCPARAIELVDDLENHKRVLKVDYCSCINCGQCEENCITGTGIKMTNEHSLAVFDTKAPEVYEFLEKELMVCECCGRAIACTDHFKWIKERLGAKAYANPNFMLWIQNEFFETDESKPKDIIRREDYIKNVCGKCRKKIVMADEF